MSADLLQFEDPIQINQNLYAISLLNEQNELEEESGDLEIIEAALSDPIDEYTEDGEDEDEEDGSDDEDQLDTSSLEKILDIIIPPSEWVEDDGSMFIQKVSRKPPDRNDVIQLWERLDMKLKERQARMTEICTIRRDLFTEAFDELIRQVTLDCLERGLLLARVRDEASMTLSAFQSLLQSASDFGASKAIEAESSKSEIEDEVIKLEEKVAQLQSENRRLEALSRQVTRRARERKEVQMALFTEELECLQRSEQQYQTLIETLLAGKNPTEK